MKNSQSRFPRHSISRHFHCTVFPRARELNLSRRKSLPVITGYRAGLALFGQQRGCHARPAIRVPAHVRRSYPSCIPYQSHLNEHRARCVRLRERNNACRASFDFSCLGTVNKNNTLTAQRHKFGHASLHGVSVTNNLQCPDEPD